MDNLLRSEREEGENDLEQWHQRILSLSSQLNGIRALHEPSASSRIPVVGALVAAARRFWSRAVASWYTQPLVEQQNRVNEQLTRTVDELGDLLMALREEQIRNSAAQNGTRVWIEQHSAALRGIGGQIEQLSMQVQALEQGAAGIHRQNDQREAPAIIPPQQPAFMEATRQEAEYWESQARVSLLKAKEEILGRFPGEEEQAYLRRFEEYGIENAGRIGRYIGPESRVLEIGCGIGRILKYIQATERWGLDISPTMLAHAQKYLQDQEGIHLVNTNGFDFAGVPDEYFDLVYSFIVLQHINKRAGFNYLCEANRVLKPGGQFWFEFMNILCEEGFAHFKNVLQSSYPLDFYTPDEVRFKLGRIGLQIDELYTDKEHIYVVGHKPHQS